MLPAGFAGQVTGLAHDALPPRGRDLFGGAGRAVPAPPRRREPLTANPNLPETTA